MRNQLIEFFSILSKKSIVIMDSYIIYLKLIVNLTFILTFYQENNHIGVLIELQDFFHIVLNFYIFAMSDISS